MQQYRGMVLVLKPDLESGEESRLQRIHKQLETNRTQDRTITVCINFSILNPGGHYVRFLRFAASDLWASLVLVDLADLARVRLLWLRARAYHKDDQLV